MPVPKRRYVIGTLYDYDRPYSLLAPRFACPHFKTRHTGAMKVLATVDRTGGVNEPWAFLKLCIAWFLLLAVGAPCAGGADGSSGNWPQFRGPGALGVSDNARLPERWGTNENVAWKVEVPGRGWSSP